MGFASDLTEATVTQFFSQAHRNPDHPDFRHWRDRVAEALREGRKVIFVAHSQGNHMVRFILSRHIEADGLPCNPLASIGWVMVGSPIGTDDAPAGLGAVERISDNPGSGHMSRPR